MMRDIDIFPASMLNDKYEDFFSQVTSRPTDAGQEADEETCRGELLLLTDASEASRRSKEAVQHRGIWGNDAHPPTLLPADMTRALFLVLTICRIARRAVQ